MEVINYGKQTIDEDDIAEVVKVLRSNLLTSGPLVKKFEEQISKKFKSKYSCVVSSGTAALHLAGVTLGWSKGDVVLTTALTFVASVNAIIYCGATPDIVDIDDSSYCIDLKKLENKIKQYLENGKKIKAVIAVDFAGHPCNWIGLSKLAKKYNFDLVNDNCHAIGASYLSDTGYAVKYADIVTHSYHPVKNITTGEGGALLTNNKSYHSNISLLRSHGINRDVVSKNDGNWFYEIDAIGYNYRLTDIQCALGYSQLNKLERFIKSRKKIAELYLKSFANDERFILPTISKDVSHAFHLFVLRINFDITKINKKDFFIKMNKKNINLQVHYIPIFMHKHLSKKIQFIESEFRNTSNYYKQAVSLPIYPELNNEQQQYVIKTIKELL